MYHKLDDSVLVSAALQQRLQDEADFEGGKENSRWWVGIVRSNGDFKVWAHGYEPEYHEKLLAEQMVKVLNKEISHGGAWVVEWTDYGRRFVMLWMDGDGDVQFTTDIDDDAVGIVEQPLSHWVAQAEESHTLWQRYMRDVLAPKPEQLFRRSLGEKSLSIRAPEKADEIAGRDRVLPVGPIIF